MLILLSLFTTSSFVVADGRSTAVASTRPLTRLDTLPLPNASVATPPGGVERPAAVSPSPVTDATTSAPTATVRDIYVRGHRIRNGDRPEPEVGRPTFVDDAVERRFNRTAKPRDDGDDDDDKIGDGLRRRRFHLISAAQVRVYK